MYPTSPRPTLPTSWEHPCLLLPMTWQCTAGSKIQREACSTVSVALEALHQAMAEKGLSVNTDKTISMVISPLSGTDTEPQSPITCHGHIFRDETKIWLLGITVDNRLLWQAHIDSIHAKVNRKIGSLRRLPSGDPCRRGYFTAVIRVQRDLQYASSAFIPNILENLKQMLAQGSTSHSWCKLLWRFRSGYIIVEHHTCWVSMGSPIGYDGATL